MKNIHPGFHSIHNKLLTMNEGSLTFISLLAFVVFLFLDNRHSHQNEVQSQRTLNYIFLITNNVEHLLKYALASVFLLGELYVQLTHLCDLFLSCISSIVHNAYQILIPCLIDGSNAFFLFFRCITPHQCLFLLLYKSCSFYKLPCVNSCGYLLCH